jgi:hypothetical protein
MTYTITYENEGQGNAFGVYIEDRLGDNLDDTTLRIFGPGQYITPSRLLTWDIGELTPKGQPGSTGTVSFTVRLKPGLASGTVITNGAVVYFPSVPEVTPTNVVVNVVQPLAALPQTLRTPAMTPIAITLQGRDASGTPLTFTVVDEPVSGVLSGSGANRTYTPATNFTGSDEFTFKVSNGITESRPATVQIVVQPSSSDTIRPAVIWTNPESGANGVRISASPAFTDTSGAYFSPVIAIQFSEAMSSTTISTSSVELLDSEGRVVTSFVDYDEARDQAILMPRVALKGTSLYTVRVNGSVRDASGNQMGAEHRVSFQTGALSGQSKVYLPVVLDLSAGW